MTGILNSPVTTGVGGYEDLDEQVLLVVQVILSKYKRKRRELLIFWVYEAERHGPAPPSKIDQILN